MEVSPDKFGAMSSGQCRGEQQIMDFLPEIFWLVMILILLQQELWEVLKFTMRRELRRFAHHYHNFYHDLEAANNCVFGVFSKPRSLVLFLKMGIDGGCLSCVHSWVLHVGISLNLVRNSGTYFFQLLELSRLDLYCSAALRPIKC